MNPLSVGSSVEFPFRLTQEQLDQFAELSGDKNPIHFDSATAARSPIAKYCPPGKMSVPGMLGAFMFSKVLGTTFPGYETVYREQSLHFKRPMFVETDYVVKIRVLDIDRKHHVARLSTVIVEKESGRVTTHGHAVVTHPHKF